MSVRSGEKAVEMEGELRMWEQNAQEAQAELSALHDELKKEREKLRTLREELDTSIVERDGKSAEVAQMMEEIGRVKSEWSS